MSELQNPHSATSSMIEGNYEVTPDATSEQITVAGLKEDIEERARKAGQSPTRQQNEMAAINGMFRVRSAQNVLTEASLQPDPVELYPNLIIENELTILFADTGIGKTVYAVQIAISIATFKAVLYVDLELSDKQFEKRYRDESGSHFQFPSNFYRADFTPRFEAPVGVTYEEYFIQSLEQAIQSTGCKVVVIDNMTKLSAGDTDSAKATIPVMENLSRIKFDEGITFLILEHNKKVDASRPISLNDLQGSKMKSNFADAVFSIGRSQTDKNLRYVKQLKVRSGELVFDTENVATYEITHENGFLRFSPIGHSSEFEHLRLPSDNEKGDRKAQALTLKEEGKPIRQIARLMGVSEGAIRKWLKS